MKVLLLLLTLLFSITINAQIFIDGPANLRESPKGNTLLSVENNVVVFEVEKEGDWHKIELQVFINDKEWDGKIIKKNTLLFDSQLNKAATVLADFQFDGHATASSIDGYQSINLQLYTYKSNIKNLSLEELATIKKPMFSDSDKVGVFVYKENGIEFLQKTEINYLYQYFPDGSDLTRYLIRKKTITKNALDAEGVNSEITLSFYPNLSENKSFSFTKAADRFDLFENYLISTKYGCCGAEDYSELADFPNNKTFLEFNSKYYIIDIPNSHNQVFVGFNMENRYNNPKLLLLGELNYSVNKNKSGKIKFFAKTKQDFESITPFCPEIKLISKSANDTKRKHNDYDELIAWSLNKTKSISAINNVGIELTFVNDTTSKKFVKTIYFENGQIDQTDVIVRFE